MSSNFIEVYSNVNKRMYTKETTKKVIYILYKNSIEIWLRTIDILQMGLFVLFLVPLNLVRFITVT